MTTETFINTARLERIAEAIAALEPCPFRGVVTADQIKMTMAEFDLLPEIIRADVEHAARADAEIEARNLPI